jgi:predicted thioesterase
MTVTEAVSAAHLGSGNVHVLSTPSLILLMEKATVSAVDPHLPPDQVSVGVRVDVSHLAATPLGMGAKAWAEVVDVIDRRVSLQVEAYDEVEKIGEGTIQRVIVNRSRFTEHVAQKSPTPDRPD